MGTESMTQEYQPSAGHASRSASEFMGSIAGLAPEVELAWKSNRDDLARPGIWLRRGSYRLKHGSFVDPSDLSCYAAQFYVPSEDGKHDCVQIGHGEDGPEDAIVVRTVGELREAVSSLVPELASLTEASSAEPDREQPAGKDAPSPSQQGFKLLQPDGAFELHGSLTKGWSATEFCLCLDDGTTDTLLVFD